MLTDVSREKSRSLGTRLVFKVKYDTDGNFLKNKARLVGLGYMSLLGRDFFSTFSPMASLTAIRFMCALAVHFGLPIYAADIPNAFIRSEIDSHITISLPAGVKFETKDGSTDGRYIVRILRSLYGLKNAPALFNKQLTSVLTKLGYTRLKTETSIFAQSFPDENFVFICTEVDDLLIIASSDEVRDTLRTQLVAAFQITEWGPIRSYFGIRFLYDLPAGTLTLDVEKQINDLFDKHPILAKLHGVNSPSLDANYVADESVPLDPLETYLRDHYRSINGVFIFCSTACRVDIAQETARAARYQVKPTRTAIHRLKRLVQYVNTHRSSRLVYNRSGGAVRSYLLSLPQFTTVVTPTSPRATELYSSLIGLSDSDYAPKTEPTRKSTSGFCFFLFSCLVSWKSKLQPVTAASTHDAELIAACLAADEASWLHQMLREVSSFVGKTSYDPTKPVSLYGDNLGSVFTANNPTTSTRSRHLDTRFFRIRDYISNKLLVFSHVVGTVNLADHLTKPLSFNPFSKLLRYLGMKL